MSLQTLNPPPLSHTKHSMMQGRGYVGRCPQGECVTHYRQVMGPTGAPQQGGWGELVQGQGGVWREGCGVYIYTRVIRNAFLSGKNTFFFSTHILRDIVR